MVATDRGIEAADTGSGSDVSAQIAFMPEIVKRGWRYLAEVDPKSARILRVSIEDPSGRDREVSSAAIRATPLAELQELALRDQRETARWRRIDPLPTQFDLLLDVTEVWWLLGSIEEKKIAKEAAIRLRLPLRDGKPNSGYASWLANQAREEGLLYKKGDGHPDWMATPKGREAIKKRDGETALENAERWWRNKGRRDGRTPRFKDQSLECIRDALGALPVAQLTQKDIDGVRRVARKRYAARTAESMVKPLVDALRRLRAPEVWEVVG